MKSVELDPAKRVADAEPGIQIAEFDNLTAPAGLAASLGVCPDVGLGGLTLGGGNGWLESVYGTACDNLNSVELVTEHEADLLYAPALCPAKKEGDIVAPQVRSRNFFYFPGVPQTIESLGFWIACGLNPKKFIPRSFPSASSLRCLPKRDQHLIHRRGLLRLHPMARPFYDHLAAQVRDSSTRRAPDRWVPALPRPPVSTRRSCAPQCWGTRSCSNIVATSRMVHRREGDS